MNNEKDQSMQNLRPTVWIGKQGCSATMIEEIVSQLKKRRMIKVKWLQNTEVEPESVAREAKAILVEVRGRTMILKEKGRGAGAGNTPAKTSVKTTAKETARTGIRSRDKSPPTVVRRARGDVRPGLSGIRKRSKE